MGRRGERKRIYGKGQLCCAEKRRRAVRTKGKRRGGKEKKKKRDTIGRTNASFGRSKEERRRKKKEDREKCSFSRDRGQVHASFSILARTTGNVLSKLLRIKSRHSIAPLLSNRSFWSPFSSFPYWRARETARPSRASPLAFPSFLPSFQPSDLAPAIA